MRAKLYSLRRKEDIRLKIEISFAEPKGRLGTNYITRCKEVRRSRQDRRVCLPDDREYSVEKVLLNNAECILI